MEESSSRLAQVWQEFSSIHLQDRSPCSLTGWWPLRSPAHGPSIVKASTGLSDTSPDANLSAASSSLKGSCDDTGPIIIFLS